VTDKKQEVQGDRVHVIAPIGEKHAVLAREHDGHVDIGLGVRVSSAADLTPGVEYAERQADGSYRVAGRIPGGGQVATDGYRSGWDRVFGGKQTVGQA
jgi:hypothetical protein